MATQNISPAGRLAVAAKLTERLPVVELLVFVLLAAVSLAYSIAYPEQMAEIALRF